MSAAQSRWLVLGLMALGVLLIIVATHLLVAVLAGLALILLAGFIAMRG